MIITLAQLEVFLLVFARMAGLFIEAPVLSTRLIPAMGKVALCVWISTVLWFVVPVKGPLPADLTTLLLALVNEVLIGFIIGFVAHVIFAGIQAAGDIMDLQMGMSIATIISPTTGGMISIIGLLAFMIALAIFVVANGHHLILSALNSSFTMLPIAAPINLSSNMFIEQIMDLGKNLWLIAVQLSAPVVLLLFLTDFAFGIVSRVAPQVNVFMLGFQVKPSIGLVGILLTMPLFMRHIVNLTEKMGEEILKLFIALKP